MATFRIHEDIAGNEENIPKTKIAKVTKNNENKQKINKKPLEGRAALQPLKEIGQNQKKAGNGVLKKDNLPNNATLKIPSKKPKIESTSEAELSISDDILQIVGPTKELILRRRPIMLESVEKEYEQDVWKYLIDYEKKIPQPNPAYMSKQAHITWDMRSVLVDWLVSVAEDYKMSDQTVHLGVNYLDNFLSCISVVREKFQLVGAASMLIAGKVEEIYPPDAREWAYLGGESFTVRQVLKMEQLVLKILQFNLNPPTMYDFIKHLCAKHELDSKTMHLAMYLSELVLLEGKEYLHYIPSMLAAASIALARHTLFKSEPWSKKLELSAGYTLKQLSPVVIKQQTTFKSSPFKENQAINKKYRSDRYERVAMMKPRILSLDELPDEE